MRTVELPLREPFDAPGLFGFLAARAVPGVEVADLSDPRRLSYARTMRLPSGTGAVRLVATPASSSPDGAAESDVRDGCWSVTADLAVTDASDEKAAIARVRHLLDADADPAVIDSALHADDTLAPLVERTPGIRVPGCIDPHEIVVRALVGQQISVAAARTHLGRLAARIGSPCSAPWPGLGRLFPTAPQIAEGLPVPSAGETLDPDRPLRLPGRSIRSLVEIEQALSSGELTVDRSASPDLLRDHLVARPGIGPWTAAYIAMRVVRDPDAWLIGDVALVAGARRVGLIGDDLSKPAGHRTLAALATRWAPWRSYAAMHLWRAANTADH